MENPINAVKSAFNVKFFIMALVAIIGLGILLGMLGLSNWLLNPWGALVNRFPSLAKLQMNLDKTA